MLVDPEFLRVSQHEAVFVFPATTLHFWPILTFLAKPTWKHVRDDPLADVTTWNTAYPDWRHLSRWGQDTGGLKTSFCFLRNFFRPRSDLKTCDCALHWARYPIFDVFAFLRLQKCAPLTQKTCTHLRKLLTQQNQSALCKSLFWNPTCIAKMEKFLLLVISPKVFELQRCATTHIEENWSNFPIFTKYL